jgi:hypothetical protein
MRTRFPETEAPRPTDDALLARLGLDGSASDNQVEATYDEIAGFLAGAPSPLRAWAQARLTEVDEAYVLLRGNGRSGGDRPAPSDVLADDAAPREQPPRPPVRPAPRITEPRTPEPRNGNHARAAMLGDALGGGDWYEPVETTAEVRPRARRVPRARPVQAQPTPARRASGLRRAGLGAGIVIAIAAVGFIGFKLGEPLVPGLTGTPAPQASGATIDQAQITAYMTRLAADASDVDALQGLANLYFAAGDFATASVWLDKLLAVEPDDIDALLGAGAVAYNLGRLDEAEEAWLRVLELEPDNVEVHYDLGFLYLAQEPPDLARVEQEWKRVIELDPDSDVARTVAAHLEGLVPAASGSPAASPADSPAASPAASPATSEAPEAPEGASPGPTAAPSAGT